MNLVAYKTIVAIQERPWEFTLFTVIVLAVIIALSALNWTHRP